MRSLRSLSALLPLILLVVSALGRVWVTVEDLRAVHVYCEEHRAVEHREDQQQDDEDDHGGACAWQLLPAGDVPLATPIAAGPVQWTEVPAPEPPALGGGARAPPLSFAPKTSPPA